MELYGQSLSRNEVCKRVGDISQIAGVKKYEFTEGRAKGVSAYEIYTASGLRFTVLPDRGLDIAFAEYNGINFSWLGNTGVVSPALYDANGAAWLRNFFGGLLTTCGSQNIGSACTDNGKAYGLHGRLSNTPAEEVWAKTEWEGDELVIRVGGKVREVSVFGENMTLIREIKAYAGGTRFELHDVLRNDGFSDSETLMLYHCNYGFPLLDKNTVMFKSEGKIIPRDAMAKDIELCTSFDAPQHGYDEQVFMHDMVADENGKTFAGLFNKALGFGVKMSFLKEQFPLLVEWKMIGESEYVVGLEPATYAPLGRESARKDNAFTVLKPGEERHFDLTFEIVKSI
ncbi:MAG: aldose 1-epimerase family protein [Clostridia bacterium]|nr:aldose 1-epimerase family protein [Clostridia bacterium]